MSFIAGALVEAEDQGCESVMAFATSAIREASNTDEVLAQVLLTTGVDLLVLSGEQEAELTFLAVRRWFGWSSGRLAVFDIGGGSLEIATGADEVPDVTLSFELGAGRLTREWLHGETYRSTPSTGTCASTSGRRSPAAPARCCGRGPRTTRSPRRRRSGPWPGCVAPLRPRRVRSYGARWPAPTLAKQLPKLADARAGTELAELPGVSAGRAHQLVAGGVVAEAVMDIFGIEALEICPWALREGVILQSLDSLSDG